MAVALPHLRELPHSLTARVGGFGDPPAGETAAEDDGSWGTLHWAARWGDPSTLQMAFEYGADLNVQTDCGDTPLHISAWGGREMVVKELIARGADPFVINKEGKAALDVACSEQIRFLLRGMLPQRDSPTRPLRAMPSTVTHNPIPVRPHPSPKPHRVFPF